MHDRLNRFQFAQAPFFLQKEVVIGEICAKGISPWLVSLCRLLLRRSTCTVTFTFHRKDQDRCWVIFQHLNMKHNTPPQFARSMCVSFFYGKCPHGSRCNFLHDIKHVDLDRIPNVKMCSAFICTGSCERRDCPFEHDYIEALIKQIYLNNKIASHHLDNLRSHSTMQNVL